MEDDGWMMGQDKWLLFIERDCEHGRRQAHGVVAIIHGEGVPECPGGDRILVGSFTMKEEAVQKWKEAASDAGLLD